MLHRRVSKAYGVPALADAALASKAAEQEALVAKEKRQSEERDRQVAALRAIWDAQASGTEVARLLTDCAAYKPTAQPDASPQVPASCVDPTLLAIKRLQAELGPRVKVWRPSLRRLIRQRRGEARLNHGCVQASIDFISSKEPASAAALSLHHRVR